MLENYIYRLSNSLDVQAPALVETKQRIAFPLRRERILETTEIREGLLEVLKLKECNLIPLIAERNSSLGKVQLPSQRLHYELQFFQQISACEQNLKSNDLSDPELVSQVVAIRAIKQQNLPYELWNGIMVAKEIELNFASTHTPLPLVQNQSTDASINAVSQLTQLTSLATKPPQSWQIPNERAQFEQPYKILYANQTGPQIYSTLTLLTDRLNQAGQMLQMRTQARPLCPMGRATPQAKIVQNVFYKYYIGEVQPYLAHSHRNAEQWLEGYATLIHTFRQIGTPIPEVMKKYSNRMIFKDNEENLWRNYLQARDRHTQAWQKLLKQCALMPTRDN